MVNEKWELGLHFQAGRTKRTAPLLAPLKDLPRTPAPRPCRSISWSLRLWLRICRRSRSSAGSECRSALQSRQPGQRSSLAVRDGHGNGVNYAVLNRGVIYR